MYNNNAKKARRITTPPLTPRTFSSSEFKSNLPSCNPLFFSIKNPLTLPCFDLKLPENIFINLFMELSLVSHKNITLNSKQKKQITDVLSSVLLRDEQRIIDCIKDQILSNDLYIQILDHLADKKKKNQDNINSYRLEIDIKMAKWFFRNESIEVKIISDWSNIASDLQQQEILPLVWELSAARIDYQQLHDSSLLLVVKYGAVEIISCLNMLFNEMSFSQLGVAQYLLFVISQHYLEVFKEPLVESLISFEKKLNAVKEELLLHDVYFLADIQWFIEQKKEILASYLEENCQLLTEMFQEIILTNAPMSFFSLFNKGLEEKKSNRKEIIWLIAKELINASNFFFQSIPLEEFATTDLTKRFQANIFISYFNNLSMYITQFILDQSSHQVVIALALIIDITKQLHSSTHLKFLDINSLMLIQTSLENGSISRLSSYLNKLSKSEIKSRNELNSILSFDNNSDAVRKRMESIEPIIPWPGLFFHDIQFAVDGNNAQPFASLLVHGHILGKIHKLQQKLKYHPVLFATSILQEVEKFISIPNNDLYTRSLIHQPKKSDEINLDNMKNSDEFLTNLEHYLNKNIIPSVVKGGKSISPGKKCVKLLYNTWHKLLEKNDENSQEKCLEAQTLSLQIVNIARSYHFKIEPLFTEERLGELTEQPMVIRC